MSAPSPLSVVIVDDDEFVAQSLRTILEARGSVRVAALGTKGAEAAALDVYKRQTLRRSL